MRIAMQPFAEGGVLAGAITGQKVFVALVQATTSPMTPEICYLDFKDVTVATTSFLRESVIAYRNHARSNWNNVYPVVANVGVPVREELEHFLRDRGDALVACDLDDAGEVSNVLVIGRLDSKQHMTLLAVIKEGEVDAPTLAKRFKQDGPASPTAWNNRLVALATKGLLMEVSGGRSKRYRPVLEKLAYGT